MIANERKYLLRDPSLEMMSAGIKAMMMLHESQVPGTYPTPQAVAEYVWHAMWEAANAVDSQPYPQPPVGKEIDHVIDLAQQRTAACIAHVREVKFGSADANYVINDENSKLSINVRVAFLDYVKSPVEKV